MIQGVFENGILHMYDSCISSGIPRSRNGSVTLLCLPLYEKCGMFEINETKYHVATYLFILGHGNK